MTGRTPLSVSLAIAAAALRPASFFSTPDSLRLDLPPIGAGRAGVYPDAASLKVFAALYFFAEHEQAGLIPAVEVLAAARGDLPIPDERTAAKLDRFAQRHDWFDRPQRNALFARLFGIGDGRGALPNADFQRLLASFCLALLAYEAAARWGSVGGFEAAQVAQAGLGVLGNLGSRQFGNTLLAARTVHDQLAAAVDILLDPGLLAAFEVRNLWDFLRKIMGDQAPDFGRLTHRGQFGQQLLHWLAASLPLLTAATPSVPKLGASSPVADAAAGWLDASGLLPPAYVRGRPA